MAMLRRRSSNREPDGNSKPSVPRHDQFSSERTSSQQAESSHDSDDEFDQDVSHFKMCAPGISLRNLRLRSSRSGSSCGNPNCNHARHTCLSLSKSVVPRSSRTRRTQSSMLEPVKESAAETAQAQVALETAIGSRNVSMNHTKHPNMSRRGSNVSIDDNDSLASHERMELEVDIEAQRKNGDMSSMEPEGSDPNQESLSQTRGNKQAPELQDQTNLLPFKQIIIVFCGISCALFVGLLDQTIVSTALPTLGRDFGRADIVSWVGTSYLLTSTAFQPIYSRLSDIFGRKILLVTSLVIFFLGSLACALAQSMIQLIVFRAIAGVGGGGVLTLSMIVISDVVSLKERGKYQGVLGGVVALANSVGPILGGTFTETIGWRWCFWINLPMTAIAVVVVVFALPLKAVKGNIMTKLKQIDYLGSILTLAFSILILMALSWGGTQYAWDSAGVLAPLLIGVALLGAFLLVEWKYAVLPLIPMHIFRDQTVAASMAATFLAGIVFFGQLYYLPQYFQVVKNASAIRSGVLLLPLVLVQTTASFVSGWVISKTGDYRYILYIGYGAWTIALGLFSTLDSNTSIAKLCGYQVLAGFGGGQTFQTLLVAIQAASPRADMAVATGARNFLRSMGGSVALAVCSALLNNAVKTHLQDAEFSSDSISEIVSDPTRINGLGLDATQRASALAGYTKGIQNVFYLMIPCSGISFFVILFFVKQHSLNRGDEQKLKDESKSWNERRKHKKHHQQETPEVESSH